MIDNRSRFNWRISKLRAKPVRSLEFEQGRGERWVSQIRPIWSNLYITMVTNLGTSFLVPRRVNSFSEKNYRRQGWRNCRRQSRTCIDRRQSIHRIFTTWWTCNVQKRDIIAYNLQIYANLIFPGIDDYKCQLITWYIFNNHRLMYSWLFVLTKQIISIS